jgi:hypothetical protein
MVAEIPEQNVLRVNLIDIQSSVESDFEPAIIISNSQPGSLLGQTKDSNIRHRFACRNERRIETKPCSQGSCNGDSTRGKK